jgi:hypothetical protein
MKLSKERKIFIGLLVLAGGGALADRVFVGSDLSTPQSVYAGDPETEATPVASGVSFTPFEISNDTPLLADRLAAAARAHRVGSDNIQDAFAPSETWISRQPTSTRNTSLSREDTIAQFTSSHKLMAVITNGGSDYAVIDGHPLAVGQSVDGFRLISLKERSAVFQSADMSIEMTLPSKQ